MNEVSVILCEGYHDRAFWYGLLEFHNCAFGKDVNIPKYKKGAGEYFGTTSGSNFVSILPVNSETNLLPVLKAKIELILLQHIDRIVVNLDPDYKIGESVTGTTLPSLLEFIRRIDAGVTSSDSDLLVNDGKTIVSLARWEIGGNAQPGVPDKQTLERIICLGMQRAYPERAREVMAWLETRSSPPAESPKALSWSYMAGWYPESGCDDFFRSIWRDPKIATELEAILRENGIWRIVEMISA